MNATELLQALGNARVDFVPVGGLAVQLHGFQMKRAAGRPKDLLDIVAFDEARAFFVQMWLHNPALAVQAGPRIRAMLEPIGSAGLVRSGRAP